MFEIWCLEFELFAIFGKNLNLEKLSYLQIFRLFKNRKKVIKN
jgi:hypothetical protein